MLKKITTDQNTKNIILKMLNLASVVDPVILNTSEESRLSLISHIQANFDHKKNENNITFSIQQLIDLSNLLNGVSVVVEETFWDFKDVPDDKTMEDISDLVTYGWLS